MDFGEGDKALYSLYKHERMYTLRTRVLTKTVYHFADSNLRVEIFSKKRC